VRGAATFELGGDPEGTPLGLTAAKFWTRTKFKGTWTLKRHVNPTRVPIETKESYRWLETLRQSMVLVSTPERCVHVADRKSDIYELFYLAQDLGTRFLVRVQTNRLAAAPADDEPEHAARRVNACGASTIGVSIGLPSTSRCRRLRMWTLAGTPAWRAISTAASTACSSCCRTRASGFRPSPGRRRAS
jgi:hypothetical protein